MNQGKTVFAQLMDFLPMYEFRQCVARYRGEYKVRHFSCYDQFLCLTFAQLTARESLRELVTCLHAVQPKLYHSGFRGNATRSTLADANEHRSWRIYADFAQALIGIARPLYRNDPFLHELDEAVYALDATTIDVCLSLFPWAHFRQHKAAIKLHTLLDLRCNIPSFIEMTDGKTHEVNILDELLIEAGAFYVMDRGYLDFLRLHRVHQSGAFFVTRAKSNLQYRRLYSHPVESATGVRCDQTVVLTGVKSARCYPVQLRRVRFEDTVQLKQFTFLTNNFLISAVTVAQLYRARWQIELFFKWIKQHLHIKAFYGTSENAVKTQIWIAISVFVLVAIVKKRLLLRASPYTILQILSISLFEKTPISQLLTDDLYTIETPGHSKQLILFDL